MHGGFYRGFYCATAAACSCEYCACLRWAQTCVLEPSKPKNAGRRDLSSVLLSLAGPRCNLGPDSAHSCRTRKPTRAAAPGTRAVTLQRNRRSTGGRAYSWSRLHSQALIAAAREHAKRRDHSALEHACTDAAAASHGRLHKSPPAVIDSHVANDRTTKDLRAHEGSDTGRRLLRLQAAGLDVVERRI